jgi:hypothetical protein
MSPWTRHLMSLSLLLAVLAGARTQCFDSLTASWAALSEARQALERERHKRERMEGLDGAVVQRMTIKNTVVQQLIAGDLTLREAAAWFKYLNERPAGCEDGYRKSYPAASAEESACLQVISWVRADLNLSAPAQAEATVRRLEAELQGYLACEGKVELPDL